MANGGYRDKIIIKKRITIVLLGIVLLFFLLMVRLFYLMIIQGPFLSEKATEQWTSEVKLSARRGKILDRNGNELALSANVYRIDLDLNSIRKYNKDTNTSMEALGEKLAVALNLEKEKVIKTLTQTLPNGEPMGSANLIRRVEKEQADKVSDLKIKGVMVSPDTKRYYPNNNFLSHVLGTTNVDGDGLTGVELTYNKYLSGVPGMRITELDRHNSEVPNIISEYTKPIDGKDVILTIDATIQLFLEKAAAQAMNDTKAKAVTIIVSNPKTGEIYGMVNKPDFNPNNPREGISSNEELQKVWRNRAVNDTYEPGSIFKIITSIAAMEENVITDKDAFNCGGSIRIGSNTIKCWKAGGHGSQSFSDIIKNSCNIGFISLGQKLGKEKLNKYIDLFGFGKVSGIDLPGEAKGIIKPTNKISEVDLATISFGQTDTANPIQFLAAINAVANDGVWIRPHVMKEVSYEDSDGKKAVEPYSDQDSKRLVSEENCKILRQHLERVVVEGSGRNAFIDGYHIAGKTGTAQKVIDGKYAPGKYISSFVGMAPSNDPKLTVLVSIDEPSNGEYYAGQVAAPIAKIIFNDIFNYMKFTIDATQESVQESLKKNIIVPELRGMSKEDALKALKNAKLVADINGEGTTIKDMNPKPGYTVKDGSKIILYTDSSSNYNKEVAVPDLTGYTMEKAKELLEALGLQVKFEGDGLVSEQSIEMKTIVTKGTTITLTLKSEGLD